MAGIIRIKPPQLRVAGRFSAAALPVESLR
jgi:hypothetical protein